MKGSIFTRFIQNIMTKFILMAPVRDQRTGKVRDFPFRTKLWINWVQFASINVSMWMWKEIKIGLMYLIGPFDLEQRNKELGIQKSNRCRWQILEMNYYVCYKSQYHYLETFKMSPKRCPEYPVSSMLDLSPTFTTERVFMSPSTL